MRATATSAAEAGELEPLEDSTDWRSYLERILPWVAVAGLFLLWEAGTAIFRVPEFILPPPSAIFKAIWVWREPILDNAAQTLYTTVVGFILAVIFGLALGVVVGASSLFYHTLYPLLIGFNSVPKVAVVPVLVIWFGIGTIPAAITAFIISFFPIVVNVAAGIATMEPELRDVLRALGARKTDILLRVGVPRSMPYFFASLKVAITLAFVGSIVAESVAANKGIGYMAIVAASKFDVPLVFAGLIVTAFMGVGMYVLTGLFERRTTKWATRGAGVTAMAG